jgi:acetyl-CoA carboxylase carboxyltransferase component
MITGHAHFYSESEFECFEQIKKLITFIPWNNNRKARRFEPKDPKPILNINEIVPGDPKQPYDVRNVIRAIVDDSDFFEIQEMWAANIVIGFGRLNGETVGFVANQPLVMAGRCCVDSSDKAAALFVTGCIQHSLCSLVDLPGYYRY